MHRPAPCIFRRLEGGVRPVIGRTAELRSSTRTILRAGMARPRRRDGPSLRDGPCGPLRLSYMVQEIRYLEFEGRRLAYSTLGEGPPIVFGPRWVSHLEEEWADPRQRAFYNEIARTHRVVRFDRMGCGLS